MLLKKDEELSDTLTYAQFYSPFATVNINGTVRHYNDGSQAVRLVPLCINKEKKFMEINFKRFAATIIILPLLAADSFGTDSEAADNEKTLTLEISKNMEQSRTVDLSWNDINIEDEMYSYQLYRRKDGEEWETRSIWNESETVDVLNIYPAQPYLEAWMTTTLSESEEPAGMGLFNIDSVFFDNFNSDPYSYMLDEAGNWKYDVLFFGSSDCNSYKDLNENSYNYVQRFSDSGRGVLFGHDTICSNFGHSYFCKFADQLGILVKYDSTVNATTSVSVVDIGTMTNFPWTIRGTLTIPSCHSYGQYVGGTLPGKEWLTLNTTQLTDDETGAHSNFYLVTYKNLGMIQTGHSNGAATDDERKVLANTLFYLHQISQLTDAKDNSFYDDASPDLPTAVLSGISSGDTVLSVSAADKGTEYNYYISAKSNSDSNDEVVDSNIVSETAVSGIKGFVYDINQNSEPMPELVSYDENNEIVQNVIEADENGIINIPAATYSQGGRYYLHAFAVDNENNVSEELIVDLDDESIVEPVVTTATTSVTTVTLTETSLLSTTISETTVLESTSKIITTTETANPPDQAETSSPETGDSGISACLFWLMTGIAGSVVLYCFRRKE